MAGGGRRGKGGRDAVVRGRGQRGVEVSMDEVSLRCMGCQTQVTLVEAVRANWQMCGNCNFFLCPWCDRQREHGATCFSVTCQRLKRPFRLGPIPVERILVFARASYRKTYREGLLYRLFFEEQEKKASPWALAEPEPEARAGAEELLPRVQEEVWKNHHLVVTKRRGGKFITWEKIV